MKRILIGIVLVCFLSTSVLAENLKENDESVHIEKGFLHDNCFYQNKKISQSELFTILKSKNNEQINKNIDNYYNYEQIGSFTAIIFFPTLIISAISLTSTDKRNSNFSKGVYILCGASLITTIIVDTIAVNNRTKAIDEYNNIVSNKQSGFNNFNLFYNNKTLNFEVSYNY